MYHRDHLPGKGHCIRRFTECVNCSFGLSKWKQQQAYCVLQEYLSSNNVSETRHCLHKLAVPFFHHEVVKQALLGMMEDTQTEACLVQLLKQLSSSGDLSNSQMSRVRHCTAAHHEMQHCQASAASYVHVRSERERMLSQISSSGDVTDSQVFRLYCADMLTASMVVFTILMAICHDTSLPAVSCLVDMCSCACLKP